MRTIAYVMLALTLAGCGNPNDWADNSGGGNDAAVAVMGATAVMNGYNNARPAMVTCYRTGMMTMCQ